MISSILLINLRIEACIDEDNGDLLMSCTKFTLKIGEILPQNEKDVQEFFQQIMLGRHVDFHMNHGVSMSGQNRKLNSKIEIDKDRYKPFKSCDELSTIWKAMRRKKYPCILVENEDIDDKIGIEKNTDVNKMTNISIEKLKSLLTSQEKLIKELKLKLENFEAELVLKNGELDLKNKSVATNIDALLKVKEKEMIIIQLRDEIDILESELKAKNIIIDKTSKKSEELRRLRISSAKKGVKHIPKSLVYGDDDDGNIIINDIDSNDSNIDGGCSDGAKLDPRALRRAVERVSKLVEEVSDGNMVDKSKIIEKISKGINVSVKDRVYVNIGMSVAALLTALWKYVAFG